MLNTNVGDMPPDIFSDYISDILDEEWTWEYLVSIVNARGFGFENALGHGFGYMFGNGYGFGNGRSSGSEYENGDGNECKNGNGKNHAGNG